MNTIELINLDWLCVNYYVENSPLLNGESYSTPFYYFEPQKYSARQFQYIYKVYENKQECAEIVCKPFSHIIDGRLHQIKINNYYLYNGQGNRVLQELKIILQARFISFCRVDICCDMVGFSLQSFMRQLHNDEIREKKPKKIAEYYQKFRNKDTGKIDTIYSGVSWGSKTSRWSAKIYDKIREIQEESGKKYILDYFAYNGIDVKNDKVWRYEFSISQMEKDFVSINGEPIKVSDENIFDFDIHKLLLERYCNLHAFCYNTGKVRFDDEKHYKILQFVGTPPHVVRSRTEIKSQKTAKSSIKLNLQLLSGYLTNKDAYICYTNILQIAQEYQLGEWLGSRYGEEMREYYQRYTLAVMGVGNTIFTNLFLTEYKIL